MNLENIKDGDLKIAIEQLSGNKAILPAGHKVNEPSLLFAKIQDRNDSSRLEMVNKQKAILANILAEEKANAGEPLKEDFDGHANCFIETGNGKALLIDFNYTHEPVEGSFPFPGVGPLKLLKETRMNHMGKLAFRWIYWNLLIKGTHIPFVSAKMSEKGKNFDK